MHADSCPRRQRFDSIEDGHPDRWWKLSHRLSGRLITAQDRERSCTAHSLNDLGLILSVLPDDLRGKRTLDIGCGFGGLALTIGEAIDAAEICGLDIDDGAIKVATARGV